MKHELTTEFVTANGKRFEVLTCGAGDDLALCLHGFPEIALGWREQMFVLADHGYRVWAPNQRGYGKSFRPPRMEDYAIERLMEDIAGLIDASGARKVSLLGHDWGAMVAWCFAARRIRPLEKLVIINVPHPASYSRIFSSPRQVLRSWYVWAFQVPVVPEWFLGRDGAKGIGRSMLRTCSVPDSFPRELIAACCANAAQPGALKAMIDWYRAFIGGGGLKRQLREGFPVIEIPTLMLWGEEDKFLEKYMTDGTDRFVRNLKLIFLPGVSHWVQQDAGERCNRELLSFLALR